MQHPLEDIIEKAAKVITTEGRVFVGVLRGLDQALNCILSDAEERVYREEGTKVHDLGTYFIRGDMIVMIGELEETEEEKAKLTGINCKPLKAP